MKTHIIIATTEGPVFVQRIIAEDPNVHSVICRDRTADVLPVSPGYYAFVRRGSGVIARDFGHDAFRIDVSDKVDQGSSWQLPVYLAHLLHARQLLGDGQFLPGDRVLWATGEIDFDLRVRKVDAVARKLVGSRDLFRELDGKGIKVQLLVPTANVAEATAPWHTFEVTGLESVDNIMFGPLYAFVISPENETLSSNLTQSEGLERKSDHINIEVPSNSGEPGAFMASTQSSDGLGNSRLGNNEQASLFNSGNSGETRSNRQKHLPIVTIMVATIGVAWGWYFWKNTRLDEKMQLALLACEQVAASPSDITRSPGIVGIDFEKIDGLRAVGACEEVAKGISDARSWFLYGRALDVEGRHAEAFHWYRKSAEQGHASAQYNLGSMYGAGTGVSKDTAKALEWYQRAASQKHIDAKYALGMPFQPAR